jgi:hypothetical protein
VASLVKEYEDGYLVTLWFKEKGSEYDRLNKKYSNKEGWIIPADNEDYKSIEELCQFSLESKFTVLGEYDYKAPLTVKGQKYYMNIYMPTGYQAARFLKSIYIFIKKTPELEEIKPFFVKSYDENDKSLKLLFRPYLHYQNEYAKPDFNFLNKVHELVLDRFSESASKNGLEMFTVGELTEYSERVYPFGKMNEKSPFYLVNAYGQSYIKNTQFAFSAVINDNLDIVYPIMLRYFKTSHLTADLPIRVVVEKVYGSQHPAKTLIIVRETAAVGKSYLLVVDRGQYKTVMLDYREEGD